MQNRRWPHVDVKLERPRRGLLRLRDCTSSPINRVHHQTYQICLNSVLNVKALVGAFNQEKALVGAFSVIVQPIMEPMDRFAAPPRVQT